MTTDDQQDAPNTAPLDGGIRQQSGPSGSGSSNSTSRESLPNNCDGGVPVPDYPASLSHNSVGDAEKRTDDAQIASMNLHAAPVDAQDGGMPWPDEETAVNLSLEETAILAHALLPTVELTNETEVGLYAKLSAHADKLRALTKHKAGA